jgi:hypothetical protein
LGIRILKDILHDFCEDLEVGVLILVSRVKGFCGEGDQSIDNLHDIFGVVSILSEGNIDAVVPEEVEFVALSVVDLRDVRLYSFAGSISTVLRILIHYMIKDLE